MFSQQQIFTEDRRSHMATDSLAKENLVMGFKFNICESFKNLFPKETKIS